MTQRKSLVLGFEVSVLKTYFVDDAWFPSLSLELIDEKSWVYFDVGTNLPVLRDVIGENSR